MKKPISKADIRSHLQQEIDEFLRDGGEVHEIARGVSGRDPQQGPVKSSGGLFVEPAGTRTLVPEVVAAIEARRKEKLKRRPAPKRSRLPSSPRQKTIYDDFGEPLRRVWVDD